MASSLFYSVQKEAIRGVVTKPTRSVQFYYDSMLTSFLYLRLPNAFNFLYAIYYYCNVFNVKSFV